MALESGKIIEADAVICNADGLKRLRGKPGKAGPVLLALCGPCKSGQTGKAPLSETAGNAVKIGGAYVNVHTAKNPGGEIRGQIGKAR